jgi:hypothetical protein
MPFFNHHKKRIEPGAAPERLRYVKRPGTHAKKADLVSTGAVNLPPGIQTEKEFCKLLARTNARTVACTSMRS